MKHTKGFILATSIFVLITAFSIAGTVNCQEDKNRKVEESYYQQLEQQYVQEMKDILTKEGYQDSGVMMTRTVCEDGSREYQVSIHISRFDKLTEDEKDILVDELKEKEFEDGNCIFTHSLS